MVAITSTYAGSPANSDLMGTTNRETRYKAKTATPFNICMHIIAANDS